MDTAGAGAQAGRRSCSECGTGRGRVSPEVVRGMVISGPHRVSTLLCPGVSEHELPYEICEGRGAPLSAWPCACKGKFIKLVSHACSPKATAWEAIFLIT